MEGNVVDLSPFPDRAFDAPDGAERLAAGHTPRINTYSGVTLIIWAVAQAQHNPMFREHLRSWLDWAAGYARRSLDG